MRKIISLFFSLIVGPSFGQYYIDKAYVNTYTNDTVVYTYWQNLSTNKTFVLNYRFYKLNSKYFLQLRYSFGDAPRFSITKNDSVWFKFTDLSTIVLYAEKEVKSMKGMGSTSSVFKGVTTYGIDAKYLLSNDDMKKILYYGIEKIRIFSSRGFDNLDISDDKQESMASYAHAIIVKPWKYKKVNKFEDSNVSGDQKKEEW